MMSTVLLSLLPAILLPTACEPLPVAPIMPLIVAPAEKAAPIRLLADKAELTGATLQQTLPGYSGAGYAGDFAPEGAKVARQGKNEIWRKPLADGSVAVALFNRGSSGADVRLRAADIGWLDTPKTVRNLWKREDVADLERGAVFRVQPHETVLLHVRGA